MELDERINRYKDMLARHFQAQGLEVHLDISVSDAVRWRPHLFVKDDLKMICDIVETETISDLQLRKYAEVMNTLSDIHVYVVMIGEMEYEPEFISSCVRYGIGILVVKDESPREILKSRSREIEGLAQVDQIAIIPSAPFGNAMNLRRCFRKCKKYLHWLENNLPRSALELIYDNVREKNLEDLDSVKLLRGLDDKLTKHFREDFESFQDEMLSQGTEAEMRVILDRDIMSTIHGRYLYSVDEDGKEIRIQLPPVNSLRGNAWDSIFTDVKIVPPFESYWEKGKDVMKDWPEIHEAVDRHLKHKMKETTLRS